VVTVVAIPGNDIPEKTPETSARRIWKSTAILLLLGFLSLVAGSDPKPAINTLNPARSRAVSVVRWFGVALSVLSVAFAIMTYFGVWNYLRGDDVASELVARFDQSYSEDASKPVRRGDRGWQPLIRIITEYTHADLPHDREPLVLARFPAVLSAKTEVGGKVFAEWTAPTTPIAILYKDWPGHGDLSKEDWREVGTLQDLHDWIRKDEADFDFVTRIIIFGLLSVCVGIFLALHA
jgi:multisubunit Na+/H+ antiporter MnhB subunit